MDWNTRLTSFPSNVPTARYKGEKGDRLLDYMRQKFCEYSNSQPPAEGLEKIATRCCQNQVKPRLKEHLYRSKTLYDLREGPPPRSYASAHGFARILPGGIATAERLLLRVCRRCCQRWLCHENKSCDAALGATVISTYVLCVALITQLSSTQAVLPARSMAFSTRS